MLPGNLRGHDLWSAASRRLEREKFGKGGSGERFDTMVFRRTFGRKWFERMRPLVKLGDGVNSCCGKSRWRRGDGREKKGGEGGGCTSKGEERKNRPIRLEADRNRIRVVSTTPVEGTGSWGVPHKRSL